jgi:probable biosynthetic protein (TIGR04098 family)
MAGSFRDKEIMMQAFDSTLFDLAGGGAAARAPATLRLGMPHLDHAGLDARWLLREACDRHWRALGDLAAMREDDRAALALSVAPSRENGWRSVTTLAAESGAQVTAELLTAFVRRADASNASLRKAEMPPALTALRDYPAGTRTRRLRARGRAAREAAEAEKAPVFYTHRVLSAVDFNGVGLLYFANFPALFAAAEHAATAPMSARFAAARREIHYFGNADCGDALDVSARLRATGIAPEPELVIDSAARRASDGRVIATCETVLRPR